jgi:hypothetical protein
VEEEPGEAAEEKAREWRHKDENKDEEEEELKDWDDQFEEGL